MNPTTFGKSEASKILVDILSSHSLKEQQKVSSIIHEFNTVTKEIVKSNLSKHLKKSFLLTTLERFKNKLNRFDGSLQTFSQNTIKCQYRISLNQI